MNRIAFLKKTEYGKFSKFKERLATSRKLSYVSKINLVNYVPANRTGIYIEEHKYYIEVFYESAKRKPESLKKIAAVA